MAARRNLQTTTRGSRRRPPAPLTQVSGFGFVAGYVDALGFLLLNGIYIAAMTGNTTQVGLSLARGQWRKALLVLGVLVSFWIGALFSSVLRRRLASPPVEVAIMAGLILAAQAVRSGLPHATGVELALLAVAMSMQGETLSRFGGESIQTIVVTNNIVKFADAVAARCLGERDAGAGQDGAADLILPGAAWASYALGALTGAAASAYLPLPLAAPAVLLMGLAWALVGAPAAARDG